MKRLKIGMLGMMAAGGILMSACSACASGGRNDILTGAEEAAECTMESLKTLDLERFNTYTDNYVETYYNWLGMPVEKEYRVFNELLQPGVKIGRWKKKYEFSRKLSEKMLENLDWEIEDVKEDGNQAEIAMEITNLNMADVMGKYEIFIRENMLAGGGTGLGRMIRDISNIADDEGGLLAVMESCDAEDLCTVDVVVSAYRENGAWKIHIDDAFINAFMGNINAEEYSVEIQQRIDELEIRQEQKLDEWEEEFTDRVERWAERFTEE